MDAKNIFIACQHYLNLIQWEFNNGTEYQYIGIEKDYNEKRVEELVRHHFKGPLIYLVINRSTADEIKVTEVAGLIGTHLKESEITICEKDFSAMMVFMKIGVVKKGRRETSIT